MAERRAPNGVVIDAPFTPPADRRSLLDRAHRGDIEGALGFVRAHDTEPRRSWRRRLATLLAIMGPGVVVMVADNDAGGVAVYAQAGQEYGLALVWLLLVLAPVLYVVQEMVARLGAVTGAGHARLIFERFGPRWGYFALSDLLVLNILTIVTEFIGVALALGYFGISRYMSVPFAAFALILITAVGSFRKWELVMWSLVGLSLITLPLAAFSSIGHVTQSTTTATSIHAFAPGGVVLIVVAMIGTTVAPWQLFFQQSNVVDKRITARWLAYERVDLAIGAVLFVLGAVAVFVTVAIVLGGAGHAPFVDAGQVSEGLRDRLGWWAGAALALALLNGSVLGAAAVTLSTAYAVGDVYGLKHSLHRGWRDARVFHASFALSMLLSAAIVLMPRAPLGIVTVGVQALAGVLLPSATVFLLLLCNDPDVLGPRTNSRWLNILAVLVVGVLIEMSFLLVLTSMFPRLNLSEVVAVLAPLSAAAFGIYVLSQVRRRTWARGSEAGWERAVWTMPSLEELPSPRPSAARTVGLIVLRGYLVGAAALVIARTILAVLSP